MYKMNLALAFSIQNSITNSSGILQATKERQQTVGFIFSIILLKRKNKLPCFSVPKPQTKFLSILF